LIAKHSSLLTVFTNLFTYFNTNSNDHRPV